MLAAATHGGSSKQPGPAGRVTPPQEVITFQRRKAKRAPADDHGDFPLFSSMAATPKKQRPAFEQTPLPPGMRPCSALLFAQSMHRARQGPSQQLLPGEACSRGSPPNQMPPLPLHAARLPPLSLGRPRDGERPPLRLKSVTSTQLVDCYASQQPRQALREQRLRADEDARRRLYGGGSWGAARVLPRLPAGMLNLGNTCYLNAVLQARLQALFCLFKQPEGGLLVSGGTGVAWGDPFHPRSLPEISFSQAHHLLLLPLSLTLQVLLSLTSFVADLQRGQQQLAAAGQPLGGKCVYAALLDCVAAKEAG